MGQCGLFWVSEYLGLWWCDGVYTEVKALVSKGLFVTDYEAFMSCEYAEKEREFLRLSEWGLRGMSCELGKAKPQAKWQANQKFQRELVSFGLICLGFYKGV